MYAPNAYACEYGSKDIVEEEKRKDNGLVPDESLLKILDKYYDWDAYYKQNNALPILDLSITPAHTKTSIHIV